MNRKGLFGVNIILIIVAFVAGVIFGGYLVVKTDESLKSITGFFSKDNLDLNFDSNIEANVEQEDKEVIEEELLIFEDLDSNQTDSDLNSS